MEVTSMVHPSQQAIALLIVEPNQQRSNGSIHDLTNQNYTQQIHQQMTQVASALAKAGWQVDQFVGKIGNADGNQLANHWMTVQHAPNHCKIYLDATDVVQFVQEFRKFAIQEGRNYPLIHTWNGLAGQVGLQLKQSENIQWIHSHWQCDNVWSQDGLEIALQTSGYPSAYVAWEIWRHADEIVVFTSDAELTSSYFKALPEKSCHLSNIEAKRTLGYSASDAVILWFAPFSQSTDRGIQQVERWLEVATQLNQLFTTKLPLFRKHQWVFIPGTLNSADAFASIYSVIQQRISQLNLHKDIYWSVPCLSKGFELYYRAANVCVLANPNEPFADKALEAIVHGCPIVASQFSGARFAVIPEETGIRVTHNTPAAWAEAIARILQGEPWVQRLQQHAFGHWHPTLGWAFAAAHLSEIYRRLLAQTISQIPLWRSQKPFSILLPQPTVAANFSDFKQKHETLHHSLKPQVTVPLLVSESAS
jgi:glycosyltransferase involved in cell wall biosynthesis